MHSGRLKKVNVLYRHKYVYNILPREGITLQTSRTLSKAAHDNFALTKVPGL